MTTMNELQRLQIWYRSQCNGDWEHSFGVEITTLDNPGWMLKIDLAETVLAEKEFVLLTRSDSETDMDWISCKKEANQFVGYGGADNLIDLLHIFLDWAES